MELREIISRFEVDRKINEASYQCKCPAHHDSKASMTVSEKDGKILIHCHAGCRTEDILREVGLTMSDLQGEKSLHSWKNQIEEYIKKPLVDYYHYKDEAGNYLYTKLRFRDPDGSKVIRYGIFDNEKDFMRLGKQSKKGTLYNLLALTKAPKGVPIHIVEGEKDVETLKKLHMTAVTAGGARDWRKEYSKFFKGRKVIILYDNDEPGKALAEHIKKDLKEVAYSIKSVKTSESPHGDVTDYMEEGHSKEELQEIINNETAVVAPWVDIPEPGSKAKPKINTGILAECIHKRENFFIARKPGSESDIIYHYEHGVYKRLSKTELTAFCGEYIPSGMANPNTLRNIAEMIIYTSPIRDFSDLNSSERFINIKNGLYDLKTKKLLPHSPDVISTIQLNCSYIKNCKTSANWISFINDLCTDENGFVDSQMVIQIQEWLGLFFSNIHGYRSKRAFILYSAVGNTGKSVIVKVCTEILGKENVVNVTFQDMGGSRWATGKIIGIRLVAVGDQGGGDIENSSVFKQLTGGDMVSAEFKGKQLFDFTFTGVILAACNILPTFTDDKGDHMFKRLEFLNCRNTIPEHRQDSRLADKLIKESDKIFMWALEGLYRYIDNGNSFSPCDSGMQLRESYRKDVDTVYRFVSEECDVTKNSKDAIKRALFYERYRAWCMREEYTPVKKKNLPLRLKKMEVWLTVLHGYEVFRGIKWKNK